MAKITIFGLAGVGKGTAGKMLAQKLGYEFKSSGDMFREMASSLNMSLGEFEKLTQKDPRYDKKLDDMIIEYGETKNGFVFESRLAWFLIPDSIKFEFTCEFDERIRRVAQRDNIKFEEAKRKTLERESTYERYGRKYGVPSFFSDNFSDKFDYVIDTTTTPAVGVVDMMVKYLEDNNLL
jgi:predicted cytidylate kinase